MTEDQIKHMVNRFLSWRLPKDFNPDAGISYARPSYHPSVDATPSGTNLFDAAQADAMVRHMVDGMAAPAHPGEVGRLRDALEDVTHAYLGELFEQGMKEDEAVKLYPFVAKALAALSTTQPKGET